MQMEIDRAADDSPIDGQSAAKRQIALHRHWRQRATQGRTGGSSYIRAADDLRAEPSAEQIMTRVLYYRLDAIAIAVSLGYMICTMGDGQWSRQLLQLTVAKVIKEGLLGLLHWSNNNFSNATTSKRTQDAIECCAYYLSSPPSSHLYTVYASEQMCGKLQMVPEVVQPLIP